MKEWTIDDFMVECEQLSRNMYTYDYGNMPYGICNGHIVHPTQSYWHTVVIDGCICDLGEINYKYPNGSVTYFVDNVKMTALEYVHYILTQ